MGWDFLASEVVTPRDLLGQDFPDVIWICTDGKSEDGETAWFGFTEHEGRNFWVVALCRVKRETKRRGGQRWVGYKFMDETVGPYRKPPAKFWKDSKVAAAFGGQQSLFGGGS